MAAFPNLVDKQANDGTFRDCQRNVDKCQASSKQEDVGQRIPKSPKDAGPGIHGDKRAVSQDCNQDGSRKKLKITT